MGNIKPNQPNRLKTVKNQMHFLFYRNLIARENVPDAIRLPIAGYKGFAKVEVLIDN